MDDIKYIIWNSKYEGNPNRQSYKIFFSPAEYPIQDKSNSLWNIPADAVIPIKVQSRFKSTARI